MHILHIYKDYYPVLGGIENHIKVLAEAQAAGGHQVTVLVTNTGPRTEVQRVGNLTLIKAGRLAHLASTPLSVEQFRQARRLRGVDIVHLHAPYPPGDLIAHLVPGSPPLVVSYHSDIVRQRNLLRFYQHLLRRTLAWASRIVVASPRYIETSAFLRPQANKCVVVPYGIDITGFTPPDPARVGAIRAQFGTPLLLFVGRLRYYKGLHFLVAALAQMRTPAHLLVVGTGPERPALQEQIQAAGLMQRIHFLDDVSDAELPTVYAAADLFVLPSHLRAEAFGIVQLEAQAAGLPIVCTELGTGTSYVTQHGVTGFVVPPADPAALARAIEVLLANPDLAQRMGAAGRQRVMQEFPPARMVARIEEVYRAVKRGE